MKYHETIYEGIEKAADEFGLLDVSKFPKKLPGKPIRWARFLSRLT